jgi:two-component system sensor histidine kinase YesM
MELAVRDDGIGMDQAALERVRLRLRSPPPEASEPDGSHSGVGVRNVDERIKLYFGPGYGLEFESRENEGTTVFIRLPAIKKEFSL